MNRIVFAGIVQMLGAVAVAAEPWTVSSDVPEHVAQYSPPVLANGDVALLIDYRNCQFQEVESYKTIRAPGTGFFPATCREGRRTGDKRLATFGRIEEEVWIGGAVTNPVSWRQKLDIFSAQSHCWNAYPGEAHVDSTAFVLQTRPVIVVQKRFSGAIDRYVFHWRFRRPGCSGRPPVMMPYTIEPGKISWRIDRGVEKLPLGERKDMSVEGTTELLCSSPDAQSSCDADTLSVTLARPKGDVAFFIVFSDSMDTSRLFGEEIRSEGYAALKDEHERAWREWWNESSVVLPDKAIERTYQTALYNLKCWSTRWAVPVGILPTHWDGKFFGFGYNASALAGAGHLADARKLGRFWASIEPVARWRAGKMDRSARSGIRYAWHILEDGSEASGTGRWLDHFMHMGTIPADCWNGYDYTGDVGFLRETYPVIKGCAEYFQTWLVEKTEDGRTVIRPVCDLERLPCPARNAFLTTCSAIYALEKAADSAKILGVDSDRIDEWNELAAALRRDLPKNETRYLAFEGYEGTSVGTLAGLYPYDVLPRDDPFQRGAIEWFARNGILAGNMYTVGKRICTWYAGWLADDYARILDGENAYAKLKLSNESVGFFNEIFEINEPGHRTIPWIQEPPATFIQTVHDMLVQRVDGNIRLAPAVPKTWKDFSFRLRAPGNKIVEAVYRDGVCVSSSVRDGAGVIDFQREIDRVAKAGGGRVVVPAGTHETKGLELRSNVELHLEKDAVLRGSGTTNDYRRVILPYSEGDWMAVVMGVGVTNVSITGEGEIQGGGDRFPTPEDQGGCQEGHRPRGVFFANASGIRLSDFTLRDAASWGIVFKCCEDVTARRVKVDSHANINNDGFDIEARNVLIEDCDVDSGDDAYCVKSNDPHFTVENVVIRNCIGRSFCNVFKIGTATHGIIRRVSFENCRSEAPRRDCTDLRFGFKRPMFANADRNLRNESLIGPDGRGAGAGIAIENVDGGIVEDIVCRDIVLEGVYVPIFIRGGKRMRRSCGIPPSECHVFRDILVENVKGTWASAIGNSISGVSGFPIRNVMLRNVHLSGPGLPTPETSWREPVPELAGNYPGASMFRRPLPAYGLWARHVEGLGLENVSFRLTDVACETRQDIVTDDVTRIER